MIPVKLKRSLGLVGCLAGIGGAAGVALGGGPFALGVMAAGVLLAQGLLVDISPTKIPVVMLHSVVAKRDDKPKLFDLWCPPAMFEGYLKYLKWRGYSTITLRQMYDHLDHGASIPEKPVILTFDDGYLDNWVYAAPLLEKYGFTGTVFMPSDFIQPGEEVRPTIKDVWEGRIKEEELQPYGYLNRAELRAASASGVLDIQCHGKTHTWLPVSEKVIGFHHPRTRMRDLRWMWWNRHVDRKPFWHTELDAAGVPWGAPIYENKLALSHKALQPDPGLEQHLTNYVADRGGESFFEESEWWKKLSYEVEQYRAKNPTTAELESDEEFRERLLDEMRGCREAIEAVTGKEAPFMCWPNGGVCPEAFDLCKEAGILAATLPSRMKQPRNHLGTRPERIGRISGSSYFRGVLKVAPWVFSFAVKLERNRGIVYMEIPIKAVWLYRRFVPPSGQDPHGSGAAG